VTPRERRNQVIANAVRNVNLNGVHERAYRQEWAESRKRAGWDPRLVDDAVSGGALERVRAKARDDERVTDKRLAAAVRALSIIDAGRSLEVVLPRRPERREAAAGGRTN
jgi:hypothetical protein